MQPNIIILDIQISSSFSSHIFRTNASRRYDWDEFKSSHVEQSFIAKVHFANEQNLCEFSNRGTNFAKSVVDEKSGCFNFQDCDSRLPLWVINLFFHALSKNQKACNKLGVYPIFTHFIDKNWEVEIEIFGKCQQPNFDRYLKSFEHQKELFIRKNVYWTRRTHFWNWWALIGWSRPCLWLFVLLCRWALRNSHQRSLVWFHMTSGCSGTDSASSSLQQNLQNY